MPVQEAPLLISNFLRVAQATLSCKSLQPSAFQLLATDSEYLPCTLVATLMPVGNPRFLWENRNVEREEARSYENKGDMYAEISRKEAENRCPPQIPEPKGPSNCLLNR
jgi:hypothetical protein